jgi:hypothetical protein
MVQYRERAPETYPVAVFVQRILLYIGQGCSGPGIAHPVQERKIFIVLDVGGNPEGHPGIVGPFDDRTVNYGQVVDAMRG